ncbi:Rap1a/Tai family immunity protein [Porticoccus sp.]
MLNVLKTITGHFVVFLMLTGLMITEGQAIEPMSGDTLLSSCKASSVGQGGADDGQAACLAYIQGYLDAIGQRTLQKDDSFQRRALETRARGQMIPDGIIGRNPYCFPPELTLQEVVEKLNREADPAAASSSGAEVLSTVLKKHFSCP